MHFNVWFHTNASYCKNIHLEIVLNILILIVDRTSHWSINKLLILRHTSLPCVCSVQGGIAGPQHQASKPIMLLRRRWHRSLVFSTAWCQGPLALSMFDFHLMWKYLAPVVRYVGFFIVRGLSRGESSSWALFKNKNTKGSVGGALQVLTDFSPSLQPECWKSPESGIKKKSGGKNVSLLELVHRVFEACQAAREDADGAAWKRGLTWAHGPEGSMAGTVASPLPLQPLN